MTLAALLAVLAALSVHNLGVERLRPALYVPACLTTTAVLVGLAQSVGIDAVELGFTTAGLGAGLALGAATVLVVGAAGLTPFTRPAFADRRMAGVGAVETAYRALVRIPFGTVVVEEVAFRGVLLAMLGSYLSGGWAVAVASALFGLWHVVPLRATLRTNGLSSGAVPLGGAVVVMTAVGGGFCWLRLATGGLWAPALVHASASATATVVAAVRMGSILHDRRSVPP